MREEAAPSYQRHRFHKYGTNGPMPNARAILVDLKKNCLREASIKESRGKESRVELADAIFDASRI